jgi:drug/metabolite transporter (DMT)-like permease
VILLLSLLVPLTVDVAAVPGPTLLLILGKSALGAFAFLLVMMSLEQNQISSALPLLGLTPAVTAFLSMPALGESLGPLEWSAIGLMMAGTYIIEKKPSQTRFQPLADAVRSASHYPIAGALVLFAVSAVADKSLVTGFRVHPLAVLFYQHIVYCLIFGTMLALRMFRYTKREEADTHHAQKGNTNADGRPAHVIVQLARRLGAHLPLITAVACITIAYRFAQLEASKDAPAALVLAVKRTSIVFASLYGGSLFSDERLTMKVIGAVLIAGSGFLILRFLA